MITETIIKSENFYVASLDGEKCSTLNEFIIEIGKSFNFPDYYGENLDALDECINDLDWLKKSNYLLIINNSCSLLHKQPEEKENIFKFFKEVNTEWANVPNFKGEEEFRKKAKFLVIYN